MQIWFLSNGSYSLKKCHNPFGKAIQPPPPYGKIPVEHWKSLHGSSLKRSGWVSGLSIGQCLTQLICQFWFSVSTDQSHSRVIWYNESWSIQAFIIAFSLQHCNALFHQYTVQIIILGSSPNFASTRSFLSLSPQPMMLMSWSLSGKFWAIWSWHIFSCFQ